MIRQMAAVGIAALSIIATSLAAQAAYRIEHVTWGNDDATHDRIYVRDATSGKRLVLSRHWGARCNSRPALNYGLGGGCWYPVSERYSAWHKGRHGWLRLW